MDLFGKKGKEPEGKFALNLHKKPTDCTPNEGAVSLMMAGVLADAEKLGVDPTKIHLILEFKDTKHTMCLNLSRGTGGDMSMIPHD